LMDHSIQWIYFKSRWPQLCRSCSTKDWIGFKRTIYVSWVSNSI